MPTSYKVNDQCTYGSQLYWQTGASHPRDGVCGSAVIEGLITQFNV